MGIHGCEIIWVIWVFFLRIALGCIKVSRCTAEAVVVSFIRPRSWSGVPVAAKGRRAWKGLCWFGESFYPKTDDSPPLGDSTGPGSSQDCCSDSCWVLLSGCWRSRSCRCQGGSACTSGRSWTKVQNLEKDGLDQNFTNWLTLPFSLAALGVWSPS